MLKNLKRFFKKKGANNTFKIEGIDLIKAEPKLKNPLKKHAFENARKIEGIDKQYVSEIAKLSYEHFVKGIRAESYSKKLVVLLNLDKARAMDIALTELGRLNAKKDELRQRELGVTEYIWRTCQDERVRPSHAENEGKKFSWDKPPNTGHPGTALKCRCYAEPILDDLFEL